MLTTLACGEVVVDTGLPSVDAGLPDTLADAGEPLDVIGTDTATPDDTEPEGPKCETDTDCLLKVTGQTPCRLSSCVKGVCTKPLPLAKGTACSQPNLAPGPCQTTACDAEGECGIDNKEDNIACGPTKCGRRCEAGVCRDETAEDYDDGNPCTNVFCDQGLEVVTEEITDLSITCDDGDECTGDEACIKGKCQGQAKSCNDGIPCTLDVCDNATGCSNVPNDAKCTGDDPCVNLACSVTAGCAAADEKPYNVGADCDDGSDCTPKTACDGAGACTGESTCGCESDADCAKEGDACEPWVCNLADKKCAPDPAAKVVCDDSGDGPCSKTSCDPKTGQCATAAIEEGKDCDDNDVCTSAAKCAAGICSGSNDKTCDDANPCTVDSCDPIAGCQKTPGDGGCDDGDPCSSDDTCTNGDCKGTQVGCNDGIDCTYDDCDDKTGKCTNTAKNDLCNDEEQCTDDLCNKASGCTNKAKDGVKCDDGDKCTNAVCGKTGKCDQVESLNKEVAGCGCQSAADCKSGSACKVTKCVAGECVYDPAPKNGQACETGDKCHVANSGKCDAGSCAGGKAKDCAGSGDGKCMVGQCDAVSGKCIAKSKADGDTCDADGSKCTPKDTCKSGACIAGAAKDCSSLNKSCVLGLCDKSTGACEAKQKADGEACDDGDFCTVLEKCTKGACGGGSLETCSEENDACNQGKCDSQAGACTKVPKTSGTTCDDGKYCTVSEVCNGKGNCGAGKPRACTGDADKCLVGACDETKNTCVKSSAPNGSKCSDGNLCTQTDTCTSGACKGTNLKDCSSSSGPCTTGVCTPSSGACGGQPKADGTACNDGDDCSLNDKCASGLCKPGTPKNCDDANACTVGDSCSKGVCSPGAPKVCNDKNDCTADSCTPKTGACVYTPINGCGGNCSSNADCKTDGNLCTDDLCVSGKCSYVNNTAACDDGNKCTLSDQCNGGACKPGSAKTCAAKECNTVSCNTSTGACEYKVTALASCSDGDACTTKDTCGKTGICQGTAVKCDDGKVCTSDACALGSCKYTNNTLSCEDGNKCTNLDKCSNGVCKSGSTTLCKGDLTICTSHACDAKTGLCTAYAANDGAACEQGSYSACYDKSCLCKLGETKFGSASTDTLYESALDGKGGVVAVGRTYGKGYEGYIVRLDKTRQLIWSKTLSQSTSSDYLKAVYPTTKGTWVAVGYHYKDTKYNYVGWVVEFDINGNIIKNIEIIGGAKNDYLEDVVVDNAGKVYAAGSSYSFGTYRRGWLVKIDLTTSKVEWQKTLAPSSTKEYVLQGLHYDATYARLTAVGYTNDSKFGGTDGLVAQWSTSGTYYWYTRFGGSSTDILTKVTYVGGYLWASGYSASAPTTGSYDGWVVRFHRTSVLTKPYTDLRYGGSSTDYFFNIVAYGSSPVVVGRKYDGKAYRGWYMYLNSSGGKVYEYLFGTTSGTSYLYDIKYIGSSTWMGVGSTPGAGTDAWALGTNFSGQTTCSVKIPNG